VRFTNSKRQPESLIKSAILNFLSLKGIFCWINKSQGTWDPARKIFRKNNSAHEIKGVADILGIMPDGRLLAIEVKSKTGHLTPEQRRFIDAVNNRNGLAFVARSIEDVLKHIPELNIFSTHN